MHYSNFQFIIAILSSTFLIESALAFGNKTSYKSVGSTRILITPPPQKTQGCNWVKVCKKHARCAYWHKTPPTCFVCTRVQRDSGFRYASRRVTCNYTQQQLLIREGYSCYHRGTSFGGATPHFKKCRQWVRQCRMQYRCWRKNIQ